MTAPEETAPSDLLVYAARPTVRVDGEAYDRASRLVLTMEMSEQAGGMSALQLRYSNLVSHRNGDASLAFEDEQIFRLGSEITVYAGEVSEPKEIFRGKVTAFEAEFSHRAPPELVIHAEDALQLARMRRRTEHHSDTSIQDIANRVAQAAGLKAIVDGFDDKIGHRMQLNESDLAFLRRILSEYDGDLQVVSEELHVAPRADIEREAIQLELYSQLRSVRVTADLAHQVSEVTVTGWDPENAERVSHVATGQNLGPGEGREGKRLLVEALAERSEHLQGTPVLTGEEARSRAEAAFDQRARQFVTAECCCDGNPQIRVGTHVRLSGLSTRFDNVYYVNRVWHRYDQESGYVTDFEGESAYWGEPA